MFKISETIKIEFGRGSYITASILNCPYPGTGIDFLTMDFISLFPYIKVVEIVDLFVDKSERHIGIGSLLLQKLTNTFKDAVILVAAGVSAVEYKEEPSIEETKKIIEGLVSFYTKNGFKEINEVLGGYQSKMSMIYTGNSLGRYFENKLRNK